MIYINLLPVRQIKQKAAARQQLVTICISFLFLLLILAFIGFFQASKTTLLNNDIEQLNKEKQRYVKTLNLIKQLEKDKELIEKRISIIKHLKKSTSLTVHILDEVADATPTNRIWLTNLSQNNAGLQLEGMALDNQTIARYMDDLKTSPYITDVNLSGSSLKTYAGRNLKAFSLSCSIRVPGTELTNKPENI